MPYTAVMPRPSFDDVSPAISKIMRANKARDTKPEMVVRRLVHSMGHRYRLHRKDLPGKPDLVFGPRRKVILVHGCFWHGHDGCRHGHVPSKRLAYWGPKLSGNRERDQRQAEALAAMGWQSIVVWECEAVDGPALRCRLSAFLGPTVR